MDLSAIASVLLFVVVLSLSSRAWNRSNAQNCSHDVDIGHDYKSAF